MPALQTNTRIASIDILRGLVMVIMALDHVRDFLHQDAVVHDPLNLQTTTPLLFFTRWVTHFCAPTFVFLSGLSAGISSNKRTPTETSAFLMKRGLWLIVVEVLIITLGLSFNPLYSVLLLQVIWAIGCSMIILGLLLRLSAKLILPVGLLLVFGHDALNSVPVPHSAVAAALLQILITAKAFVIPLPANHLIIFLYAVLPWTGIMLLGYAVSAWYKPLFNRSKRKTYLLYTGLASLMIFAVLRYINQYGDPLLWSPQKDGIRTFMSFINVNKYPPSLLYTSLTLAFALLFLAFTERVQNGLASVLTIYGKVPFFYYILHFYLIHTLVVIVFFASGYTGKDVVVPNSPFLFRPATMGFSLGVTYAIWMLVVAALYLPCKWYVSYKQRHRDKWWLSYV